MPEETKEVVPSSMDGKIESALIKQNVTEAVIAKLREDYLPLKIAGIDDKETYLLVKDGRKKCKELRVLAKKICVEGREDAVAIQKAWVAKEKEVTGQIGEVEDYLERQEKEYEAAVAKEKEDRKRRHEEQLIMRQQALTSMGALYSDGNFVLGEVSFELSVVKESEPDIWEESILPKFKAEYEKVEAERIEQDRIKQEHEAKIKRQEEDLERKRKELEDKEAALKREEEAQEKKRQEEITRKAAEESQRIEALWRGRLERLRPIGWNGQEAYARYDESVVVATYQQLIEMDEKTFENVLNIHQQNVATDVEQKEQKRLSEIEEQKVIERQKATGKARYETLQLLGGTTENELHLGTLGVDEWLVMYELYKSIWDAKQKEIWEAEQEEKSKQDELKRQQELEQAKDKEKWDDILAKINEVVVHEMRSSQYRKKAMILREKLEEIKSL
jgi:hypothetical protein